MKMTNNDLLEQLEDLVGSLRFSNSEADIRRGGSWGVYVTPLNQPSTGTFDALIHVQPSRENKESRAELPIGVMREGESVSSAAVTNTLGQAWFRGLAAGTYRAALCNVIVVPFSGLNDQLEWAAKAAGAAAASLPKPLEIPLRGGDAISCVFEHGNDNTVVITFRSAAPQMNGGKVALWFTPTGGPEVKLDEDVLAADETGVSSVNAFKGKVRVPRNALKSAGKIRIEVQEGVSSEPKFVAAAQPKPDRINVTMLEEYRLAASTAPNEKIRPLATIEIPEEGIEARTQVELPSGGLIHVCLTRKGHRLQFRFASTAAEMNDGQVAIARSTDAGRRIIGTAQFGKQPSGAWGAFEATLDLDAVELDAEQFLIQPIPKPGT